MIENTNVAFHEFRAYWKLSEEMVATATKEQIAEVARILAMQAAHYARTYGELPLPNLNHLLNTAALDTEGLGLLRDGTQALVGVMASTIGIAGFEDEVSLQ